VTEEVVAMQPIETRMLSLAEIHESPWNPRKHYDATTLQELAESIAKVGILSPILVRPRPAGGYEIGAGHRRRRAAGLAKCTEVPCIVRPMDDTQFLEVLTIENLQREDVHPLDEGEGYRTLMQQAGYDVDTVAAKVGKSKSYVYQRLKLAELVPEAKDAFVADQITAGHAVLIARLTPTDQAVALEYLLHEAGESWYELMSVRELSRWIEDTVHMGMVGVPWRKDDAGLVPAAGACSTCPKRSGNATDLFPDLAKKDVCTDRACFAAKRAAHLERTLAKAAAKGEPLLQLGDWDSRGKDYLRRGQDWTEAEPKSCAHVRKGLVMSGHDTGTLRTVCAEKSCKIHHGHGAIGGNEDWRAKQKAKEAKHRREVGRRRRILEAIRGRVTHAALTQEDLSGIATAFFGDIWAEYRKQIAILEGWYTQGTKNGSVWAAAGEAAEKQLHTLDRDGLARLLITMSLVKSAFFAPYDGGAERSGKALVAAATRWGVDVAAIDAELKREEKAKADKAKAKAAKELWKSKGNGKAAAVEYDEPTCTKCGCTEGKACETIEGEPCGWVTLDKKTNAGLCSACATPEELAAAEQATRAKVRQRAVARHKPARKAVQTTAA
jgi:ParB/RepB/Spo0J family partition protein